MAFAGSTHIAPQHGLTGIAMRAEALVERIDRYRLYRRTLAELAGMGERELAEIGLCRRSIRAAAHEAVYGSQG